MEFQGQYLTYQEYQSLGGTLSQMPFNLLELEARKTIDRYTFGRLENLGTQKSEVKGCDFDLIMAFSSYNGDIANNKGVASENIDGYSISYQGISNERENGKKSQIKGIIENWLSTCKLDDGTPYLYRGAR